tara:strand:+ start:1798 stop:3567 length:1770 start_codon:yes stop_codon:yes gene_type:complete
MNIKQIIKEEIVGFLKTISEAKFKPGDMWSKDFDYRGMMTYGAKVKINVGLKTLEKLYDSLEDVNYHSENRLLYPAIESLRKGDKSTAASQLKLFNKECIKTLKSFKEGVNEARMKRVTKSMWKKMDDDARVNALLSAFKDPDDAEEHAEEDWNDLPSVARANMYVYEGKLNESTPAKVQKTQSELVKTIDALKKNFPMYKAAKESGDKSKLEKHRKIALALTKKKKELEKKMDSDLKGLYSDAELQLEKGKGLWANIHAKRKRGGKAAKKGEKGYPDEKAWKSTKKASESKVDESEMKGKYAGNIVKKAPAGKKLTMNGKAYTSLGKGKWKGPDGEKLSWIEVSSMASALGNKKVTYEGEVNEAAAELNKLKDAIKMFQDKIKKQGRITNARDEEHLKNLIALYKKMGGKGIKEGKLNEAPMDKKFAKEYEKSGKALRNHIKHELSKKKVYTANQQREFQRLDQITKMAMQVPSSMAKIIDEPGKVREGKLNEDVWKSFLNDDPGFKLYTATNTEKRKSVKARATNKTWEDGVPVLKYIARAPLKLSPLPKGKFKIIEDNKYGWWYYQVGSTWYGISQKDYGTPPFEY